MKNLIQNNNKKAQYIVSKNKIDWNNFIEKFNSVMSEVGIDKECKIYYGKIENNAYKFRFLKTINTLTTAGELLSDILEIPQNELPNKINSRIFQIMTKDTSTDTSTIKFQHSIFVEIGNIYLKKYQCFLVVPTEKKTKDTTFIMSEDELDTLVENCELEILYNLENNYDIPTNYLNGSCREQEVDFLHEYNITCDVLDEKEFQKLSPAYFDIPKRDLEIPIQYFSLSDLLDNLDLVLNTKTKTIVDTLSFEDRKVVTVKVKDRVTEANKILLLY